MYVVHRYKPEWQLETRCNPILIMYGCSLFPVNLTTNLLTSGALAIFFMGYMLRYRPVWFRKYNYLLGVGLDCGSQICQTVIMLAINLTDTNMPFWWGNDVSPIPLNMKSEYAVELMLICPPPLLGELERRPLLPAGRFGRPMLLN